jgi:glycyl-tRNA synthetase beta subunit
MAKDLLFEIGTEEIPPALWAALKQCGELAENSLKEQRLAYARIDVYGHTPRLGSWCMIWRKPKRI